MRRELCLLIAMLGSFAGCQCCSLTEPYQDTIDHISDHQGRLDWLYHPGLDISRIGRPDWCQYRWNQWICGHTCRCNQLPPPHVYPASVDLTSSGTSQPGEIPPVPPADPPPPDESLESPVENPDALQQEDSPPQLKRIPDPDEIGSSPLLNEPTAEPGNMPAIEPTNEPEPPPPPSLPEQTMTKGNADARRLVQATTHAPSDFHDPDWVGAETHATHSGVMLLSASQTAPASTALNSQASVSQAATGQPASAHSVANNLARPAVLPATQTRQETKLPAGGPTWSKVPQGSPPSAAKQKTKVPETVIMAPASIAPALQRSQK